MRSYPEALNALADSLAGGRAAVFCGAGISVHSGVPQARELVDALLGAIGFPAAAAEEIATRLPFEALMETLRTDSDETVLLDMFALGTPNRNHALLAKLIKAGRLRTICTVNFDEFIEQALLAEGMRAGGGYELASSDAALDKVAWGDPARPRLLKIHGTASDRSGMAITLRQVASSLLSAQRQSAVERMFASGPHDDVVVLGYSGSDAFDLSPHIETLASRGKRVLVVQYVASDDERAYRVEAVPQSETRSPFRNFGRALRIWCNTDRLVEALWPRLLDEPAPALARSPGRWRPLVAEWARQLDSKPALRHALRGQLSSRVSQWSDAAASFEQAIGALAPGERAAAGYRSNAGIARAHLGQLEAAIAHHEAGIRVAREHRDLEGEATNLQGMANIRRSRGDIPGALADYRRAAEAARELDNQEGVSATHAAIGMALGQLKQPEEGYEQLLEAVRTARTAGLVLAEARAQGDIGALFLMYQKLPEAARHFEEALALAVKIGAKELEARVLANLGLICLTTWDAANAVPYLERSLVIARAIHERQSEALSLGALGESYIVLERREDAIAHFSQARQIGEQLGIASIVERALDGIARASP